MGLAPLFLPLVTRTLRTAPELLENLTPSGAENPGNSELRLEGMHRGVACGTGGCLGGEERTDPFLVGPWSNHDGL